MISGDRLTAEGPERPARTPAWWAGRIGSLGAAMLSGLLLALSFAPFDRADAAWIALAPLLIALRYASPRQAFLLGFLAGALFWLLSIHWLTHVSHLGWVVLSLYCALYLAAFAWVAAAWMRLLGTRRSLRNLGMTFGFPLVWAGFEHIRSTLFTGFPWNLLGVSQYRNLPLIQIAEVGGVLAVSAVVVMVNTALALTILRYVDMFVERRRRLRAASCGQESQTGSAPIAPTRFHPELIGAVVVLLALFSLGLRRYRAVSAAADAAAPLRIAAVQPCIPQVQKWNAELAENIYTRLSEQTRNAQAVQPDLIVWPETALPDCVRVSERSSALVGELLGAGIPILVGALDVERDGNRAKYYNSSFLFRPDSAEALKYDKRHLVIFGEYVPFEKLLPFLRALTPIEGNISPGRAVTVFSVKGALFSVLICFEDTVASLSRESVRAGARLLINQTNDAWFDVSAASWQHMAHCVFRCVENRVPAVRVANTGVSCFIDSTGLVRDVLADQHGSVLVCGFRPSAVLVPPAGMPLTLYTRYGGLFDTLFLLPALVATLHAILALTRRKSLP